MQSSAKQSIMRPGRVGEAAGKRDLQPRSGAQAPGTGVPGGPAGSSFVKCDVAGGQERREAESRWHGLHKEMQQQQTFDCKKTFQQVDVPGSRLLQEALH